MANLKTAFMLFVVTVVFIITFFPAFLMALRLIPYNIIVFYFYFANNVANPVIYSFMNQVHSRVHRVRRLKIVTKINQFRIFVNSAAYNCRYQRILTLIFLQLHPNVAINYTRFIKLASSQSLSCHSTHAGARLFHRPSLLSLAPSSNHNTNHSHYRLVVTVQRNHQIFYRIFLSETAHIAKRIKATVNGQSRPSVRPVMVLYPVE